MSEDPTGREGDGALELEVARKTASLRAALEELEAFTYSVSHDLKGPLRALDGFSQALLEDYGDRLDETGLDYLRRIRRASQRMGRVLDDLLRLSRLSRGDLKLTDVDLSELAREVVEELREQWPHHSVRLQVDPEIVLRGDRRLLRIVLENLLGNAWKFTEGVEEPTVEVLAAQELGEPAVEIRDNGAGFDSRYADKLFAPFQRLHREDEFAGHGIGLATVQRIVHRHGGRIRATGAPGEGAAFRFTVGMPDERLETPRSLAEVGPDRTHREA